MSLRRRGGIWWIDIRSPQGERIRRTTETANKALAQEFHRQILIKWGNSSYHVDLYGQ